MAITLVTGNKTEIGDSDKGPGRHRSIAAILERHIPMNEPEKRKRVVVGTFVLAKQEAGKPNLASHSLSVTALHALAGNSTHYLFHRF